VRRAPGVGLLGMVLTALAGACASSGAPAPVAAPAVRTLAAVIDSIVEQPPLHRTHWGVHVIDAATGAVLYSRAAERHFIPASNMKLVVGAVSLARFGEEHRYRTDVLAAAPTADSVATLLVAASGDPTWSMRFYPAARAPLDSLALRITQSGVLRARELVVDATRFRDELVHSTWEVGDLPGSSAPPVDALAMAEGMFRLELTAGPAVGAPGQARVIGDVPQPVRAEVTTDTAGARATTSVDFTMRRDTVFLRATVGLHGADTVSLAVTRPADVTAQAFADALRRAGVSVESVRVLRDTAAAARIRSGTARVVASHSSPPMREIVARMLAPSQNWIAEQLLKTLGAEFGSEGSWRGGLAVERAYLFDVAGIDSGAVNLRDASGLSAQNLLTPAATVALLAHARGQPWGAAYRAGLPTPGTQGTLSGRLRSLEGRVSAKTGTISNVNSLSGYLVADDGRELIFGVFTNGSGLPSAVMRSAIDSVVVAIAHNARR
jgi:D-alanyl-D-alanine carboxypeptidase/D-alanyl-D-alanine-endopeptidase (penicillin-binding protein 4)